MIYYTYRRGATPEAGIPASAGSRVASRVQLLRQELRAGRMEDQRRLFLRRQMAHHNKKLAAAARRAGVVASGDFSHFQNEGYRGLYGGSSARELREQRGLEPDANILDVMGSAELAANLFRATQTEEKLRRDGVADKDVACRIHHFVGQRVREAMAQLGGTAPEDLPLEEPIERVRRRLEAGQGPPILKAI